MQPDNIDHRHGFLSADQATHAFVDVRDELAWEAREIVLFGRRMLQPRLVAWAGALPYRYSGQTLPPRAFTPTVARLLAEVNAATDAGFNHVLANRYRDGNDSMGLHADDEPELGPDPLVATLSLGAARPLLVVPHGRGASDPGARRYVLESGDLFVMRDRFQRDFRHGIPKSRAPIGERISLTFRRVLRAP